MTVGVTDETIAASYKERVNFTAYKHYRTTIYTVVLLVLVNLTPLFVPWSYSWLIVALTATVLGLIAWRGGLSIESLGLARQTIRKGLLWGGAAAFIVFAVLTATYLIAPGVFKDSRYDNGLWHALLQAIVIVPLHTVLVEEFAFRGVLLASISRFAGLKIATIASSLAFGLWHIVPSLNISHSSSLAGDNSIFPIIGIVFATTLAGIAFCELRRRSGSLLAPILAHWAINGIAVVLAAFAWT